VDGPPELAAVLDLAPEHANLVACTLCAVPYCGTDEPDTEPHGPRFSRGAR